MKCQENLGDFGTCIKHCRLEEVDEKSISIRPNNSGRLRKTVISVSKIKRRNLAMLKKLICLIKGHAMGEWEYLTDNSCTKVRFCDNGIHKEQMVDHEFEWVYDSSDSCYQKQIC